MRAESQNATIPRHTLPLDGYVRLDQLVNNPKKGTLGIIPIGRSTWLKNQKAGIFPAPVKLSERTVGYKVEDIRALIEKMNSGVA
ncbi:MAG: AlpA family transcriptional regulator [Methylococcales bacterium]